MLHIAICDDNSKTVDILKGFVLEYYKRNNIPVNIEVYTQSKLLMFDLEEKKFFNLILTDIEMPDLNGMELTSKIKKYLPDAFVIFITSHLKYTIDAFELSVFRYIPKNQISERLPHALEDAANMILMQSDKYYTIQTAARFERIAYRNIMHIVREGKNSVLYLADGSSSKVRKSLSDVFREINSDDFIFVDRGEIVNLMYIMSIKDGNVELKDGNRIPVSQARLQQIKLVLNDFWSERI